MRIGVDIDDTIAKTHDKIMEEALKYDKERVKGRGFKNPKAYTFMELFYWSVLDVEGFLRSLGSSNYYYNLEPVDQAAEYIGKLFDERNEIIFITRRRNSLKIKNLTKKWLKKYGFKYNKIVFGADEKGSICNDLDIDLLIDNDMRNILDVADYKIDGLLVTDELNKDEKGFNRAKNWKEIYKYVRGKCNGKNS